MHVSCDRVFVTSMLWECSEGMLVYCVQQAKKLQRKNFSHSEARLREIKRENKMMVDRLAHVAPSQSQTPLPPAPVRSLNITAV